MNGENKTADESQKEKRPKPPIFVRIWRALWKRRQWRKIADRPRVNWAEKLTVLITLAILIVGAIQARIYWRQTQLMKASLNQNERAIILNIGQLGVANRNANTASATLEDSHKSFVIEERPYIVLKGKPEFVEKPAAHVPIEVNSTIENIGKTPAFSFIWVGSTVKFHPKSNKPSDKERELLSFLNSQFRDARKAEVVLRKTAKKFGIEQDIAPGESPFATGTTQRVLDVLTDDEVRLLQAGDFVRIYRLGLITYYDSSGNRYETEYCAFFSGTDFRVWHICENHNKIR